MSEQYINEIFKLEFSTSKKMKIPVKLSQYTIGKLIIDYAKCVVVSSNHPTTKDKVAIKCIPIKYFEEDPQETEIMSQLTHPNIIRHIESFSYPLRNPRFFAIVMPRAVYDLLDYLNKFGPFSEKRVWKIMKQALEAIDYMHSINIWHRDLKLDNILVMEEKIDGPYICVTDFGYADIFENEFYEGPGKGTLQYAAPELLQYTNNRLRFKEKSICLHFKSIKILSFYLIQKV